MKQSEIAQKISDWQQFKAECRRHAVNAAVNGNTYFAKSFLNQAKMAEKSIEILETIRKNELKRRT